MYILTLSDVGIQIEVHAYLNQKKLIELCRQYDMIVTSYGPLGRPGFQKDASEPVLILDPKVIELSEKYGRTPAQIVLRYLVCWAILYYIYLNQFPLKY
jgi:diketogulonate reductase-like aldo/keto reductase